MKTALTIAGSDPSGGAGIQADIKTMTMNGVYATSAITALTVQNTLGVSAVEQVKPELLSQQIDAVFEDIFPDCVKIGMVGSTALIEVIAEKLSYYKPKKIVVDPIIASTGGRALIKPDAVKVLSEKIFPAATIITPNIPEAQTLSGLEIKSRNDIQRAAEKLFSQYGCAVLLKGGHSADCADDLLCTQSGLEWFEGQRIDNPNTHGTGCTLSSAIAANLAKGFDLSEAVGRAKQYISMSLNVMLDLGRGRGPLAHALCLDPWFAQEKHS